MRGRKKKKKNVGAPVASSGSAYVVALFAVTLFVGASLLFSVEPLLGKMVLPLLGGTPAVWTTCMVFFQVMLLAGYAYAHVGARLPLRTQLIVHSVLLVGVLLLVPFRVKSEWVPRGDAEPTFALLRLLFSLAAGPFFVLSTTAPLLQRWLAGTDHPAGKDPYFLYAASNLGSLLALVAYPLWIEPNLRLGAQSAAWAKGYALLVTLSVGCALVVWQMRLRHEAAKAPSPAPGGTSRERLRWLAMAFVPSSLMLATTTYLTSDVAPVPLLWVVPLGVYLASFVVAFANAGRRVLPVAVRAMPVMAIASLVLVFYDLSANAWLLLAIHVATLLTIALGFHGQLAFERPPPARLTEFYLILSVGGALGGLFNALVAPALFDRVVEIHVTLALALALMPWPPVWSRRSAALRLSAPMAALAVVFFAKRDASEIYRDRSFFGVITVKKDDEGKYVQLFHGNTMHGMQSTDPKLREVPLSYFHPSSPIGRVFQNLDEKGKKPDVAVIGLGVGNLAAYAFAEQSFTFYEIDPAVVRVARESRHFSFLEDAKNRGAAIEIVVGDARIQLANARSGRYDLIVVDAFSSDAIPVHLLTREAMKLYVSKLSTGGIVAFHITNRYLDLSSVVGNLATDAGMNALYMTVGDNDEAGRYASRWVVTSASWRALEGIPHKGDRIAWLQFDRTRAVWTDDYANVVSVIDWSAKEE